MMYFLLPVRLLLIVTLLSQHALAVTDPFGPCPLGMPSNPNVKCASFNVPLDWKSNNRTTISVLATKFEDLTATSAAGNLWYLNFGCDAWSPEVMGSWMETTAKQLNYRIITPNMRGDGLSYPRLYCAADPSGLQDPPTVACAQDVAKAYGAAGLQYYNLDNAAQDINSLVTTVAQSQPGPNYLLASGYGALWAQRVVALYPTLFTRVIISSYTSPMLYDFFASFGARSSVISYVLSQCSADTQCANQVGLGVDPLTMYENLMSLAETNSLPCNRNLPAYMSPSGAMTWRDVYLDLFTALIGPDSPFAAPAYPTGGTAAFIPSLLYRLWRCNAADVFVIATVWNGTLANKPASPPPGPAKPGTCYMSTVLVANVLLNELIRTNPTETMNAMVLGGILSRNNAYAQAWLNYYAAFPIWRFPDVNQNDAVKWYNPKAPSNVAMFSGALDPYLTNSIAQTSSLWSSVPTYITLSAVGAPPLTSSFPSGTQLIFCVQYSILTYLIANSTLSHLDPCVNAHIELDFFGSLAYYQSTRNSYYGSASSNIWSFSLPVSGCFVNPAVPFTASPNPSQNPGPSGQPLPPPTPQGGNVTNAEAGIDGAAVAGGIIAALIVIGLLLLGVWKYRHREPQPTEFHTLNYQPPSSIYPVAAPYSEHQ